MEQTALLATAFLLGAAHAVEPGHGKSVMVGALLGSKRPWRDPIAMGIGTAGGHALGVFVFAHLSFFFAHELLTGEVRKFIEIGIGTLLVLIGATWFTRLVKKSGPQHAESCSCCKTSQSRANNHVLPGVGFLIGLIPCPTVVALAVSSVSFSHPTEVFLLSTVFGLGVALTLCSIGLLITHFSKTISKSSRLQTLSSYGRFIGPVTFFLIGAVLLVHSLTPHH